MNELNFFTKRYTQVSSIDDFYKTDYCLFLDQVFGNIIYTEKNCPNFLNVHKDGSNFIISEGIYYDMFPDKKKIGSFIPKNIFKELEFNETGGNSYIGKMISNTGFAVLPQEEKINLYESLEKGSWYYHDKDHEGDKANFSDKYFIFQDVETDSLNPKIKKFSFDKIDYISNSFTDNYLMNHINVETIVHRMKEGHGAPRHYDSDVNGMFVFPIACISWFTKDNFAGREFIAGIRDEEDLRNWLSHISSQKDKKFYDEVPPKNYTDLLSIKPSSNYTIIANALNPLFYHGVNLYYSGNPIFSIIQQWVLKGESPRYNFLYERN